MYLHLPNYTTIRLSIVFQLRQISISPRISAFLIFRNPLSLYKLLQTNIIHSEAQNILNDVSAPTDSTNVYSTKTLFARSISRRSNTFVIPFQCTYAINVSP